MVTWSGIVLVVIAALVLGSGIAYAGGMLLVIGEADDVEGLPARHAPAEDGWHEVHITGSHRLRSLGPAALPALLLAATALSCIAPEENCSGEDLDLWEDGPV